MGHNVKQKNISRWVKENLNFIHEILTQLLVLQSVAVKTKCADKRSYLLKVDGKANKSKGRPLFRPHWKCGPLWPFWIFEVLIEGIIESNAYLMKVDIRGQ